MKNLSIKSLLTISATLLLIGCQPAKETVFPYSFDTAVIKYNITGAVTGESISYYRGDDRMTESTTTDTILGTNREVIAGNIAVDGTQITYDKTMKTAYQSPDTLLFDLEKLPKEERVEMLTLQGLNIQPGTTIEDSIESKTTKTIAGKTCDFYVLKNDNGVVEACLWETVPLYAKIVVPNFFAGEGEAQTNEFIMEATSVEIGIKIEDSIFEIPEGVEVKDAPSTPGFQITEETTTEDLLNELNGEIE